MTTRIWTPIYACAYMGVHIWVHIYDTRQVIYHQNKLENLQTYDCPYMTLAHLSYTARHMIICGRI
jgi:hypothetical protein